MKIARTFLITAAAVMVLAGCGLGAVDAPSPLTPGEVVSPTPTPTQVRETGLTPPARPFDGDCANLLTEAEASSLLGESATLYPFEGPQLDATVALHAGVWCFWVAADRDGSVGLDVVLLPEQAVSYDIQHGCEPAGEMYGSARCAVEAVANGTRISGSLWDSTNAVDTTAVTRDAFVDLFTERANAATPAPVPIPAIGAWALPVDCASVVAAGDFSAVPGLGASSTGDHTGGTDVLPPAAEMALWGGLGMPYCEVRGEAANVLFVGSGGGRWLESSVAETTTPFAIEGYESAYVSPGQDGLTKVDIFDGPNWLHFEIRYTKNAKALADALFAALNTTAAS
jgi:hypothetical protein